MNGTLVSGTDGFYEFCVENLTPGAKYKLYVFHMDNAGSFSYSPLNVTIPKAGYTADTIEKTYYYARENEDDFNVYEYVPQDYGWVEYGITEMIEGALFTEEPSVDSQGNVTFTTAAGSVSDAARFKVVIKTDTYEPIYVPVIVTLVDKQPVKLAEDSAVTVTGSITEGAPVSDLTFAEAVFLNEEGDKVTGDLSWKNGSETPAAGKVTLTWVFTPADEAYAALEGTVEVMVEAEPTPIPTAKPTAIPTPVPADKSEIESCLFDAVYYAMANADVAETLGTAPSVLYEHWLTCGKAEGRSASLIFDAKYYLEVNQDVAALVGSDYEAAYEHFVAYGLEEGRESSPVFDVKYYLRTNTDVAQAFAYDYVKAANHFSTNALAEGRSGSGNFDYTVYRYCNTDVAALYGEDIVGYYIHYINHGRAEGRTAGFGSGADIVIDTDAVSYRIFDKDYYLENYPALARTVGTTEEALYSYWLSEGIALGHVASPVFNPAEYLEINTDVAEAVGSDLAAATNHFFNYGIYEGRTGVWEFDYTVYKYCNTDVVEVFGEDIVGYYFHYVKYGRAEGRTAKLQ